MEIYVAINLIFTVSVSGFQTPLLIHSDLLVSQLQTQ